MNKTANIELDIKAIANPEISLLLCCSRTRLNDSIIEQINSLVQRNLDWDYLISIAARHGMLALLFNSLNNTRPEAIPENIFNKLRSYFQDNIRRNLLLTSQLLKILEIFQANNIQAVPFKGPMLAVSVYGNPAYRQFCDLDILVHQKDFTKAKQLLLQFGYYSCLSELDRMFVYNHAFQTSFRHSNGFNIDLHWGIAPRKPGHHSKFNCLWNNLVSISIGGKSVPSFSPESTLIIQCINAAKEQRYNQTLKQICDINETIRTYPELSWNTVLRQARQLRFTRLVLIGLFLTQKLYGTILPNEVMKIIVSSPTIQKLTEESKQHLFLEANKFENDFVKSYFINKYNFQTTEPRDRLFFLFDKIITPHGEDRQFVTLPPSFYYLYYLIRPIRLIGKSKVIFKRSSPKNL